LAWLAFRRLQEFSKEVQGHIQTNNRLTNEVAERQRAEQALRISERRFAGILDIASEAVVSVDQSQRIQLFNQGAEAIFGYAAEEVLGRPLDVLLPSRIRKAHQQHIQDFARSLDVSCPMNESGEIFGLCKDGTEFPAEASISKLELGGTSIFTVSLRDITERKRAEEELVRSRGELEMRVHELQDLYRRMEAQADLAMRMSEELSLAKAQLFDAVASISEGFALWDAEDKLVMCNENYRELYPTLGDVIVPGVAFEEFIRAVYDRGVQSRPEGDLEKAIQERVIGHRTSVSAFEQKLSDGRWVKISKRKMKTNHVVGIISDISERKESEAKIQRMALEDALTGLPNRAQFQRKLKEAIALSERTGNLVGLMLLDLDRFKQVNDTLGHPLGDELLRQVSRRLLDCARKTDTVARLGGDEFAVIATNTRDIRGITMLADRIVLEISKPFVVDGHEIHTGTSIGITEYPQDRGDSDQLLRNADLALYRAKERGRGTWQIYDEQLNTEVQSQRQLENELRRGLDRKEFHVVYQPRVDIPSGEIVGAEALLRWSHPERGMVAPAEFIPVAESTGLIVPITQWLLGVVCAQNKKWQNKGFQPVCVSINLSPVHFKQQRLVEQVKEALRKARLDAQWLELEITEGIAMAVEETTLRIVEDLKKVGVKLSIDDFGTGYSSLGRLKTLPVDRLKIDRSFVRDITTDANDAAICSAAIRLGHSLNIEVIAEGVETKEQLEFLIEQGCKEAQGHFFSRPLDPKRFGEILRRDTHSPVPFAIKKTA
jgi:diguanylate cyclase (GGDEF)-like protein/PAS domain S-box-containing protein